MNVDRDRILRSLRRVHDLAMRAPDDEPLRAMVLKFAGPILEDNWKPHRVKLDELSHIKTRCRPERLKELRADPRRARLAILLEKDGGKFYLEDGNHRLQCAREFGEETILAHVIDGEGRLVLTP